jgi:CRISPR system Cascade subunit CasA
LYGKDSCNVDDICGDELAFNSGLLDKLGEEWCIRIIAEIETTENMVRRLVDLADNIAKAARYEDKKDKKDKKNKVEISAAEERAYFELDVPFREWLLGIDPETSEQKAEQDKWFKTVQETVRRIGAELVSSAGTPAIVGRENMSAPKAYGIFLAATKDSESAKYKPKKDKKK